MRRPAIGLLALLLGSAAPALAETRAGVQVHLGDAPPPPVIEVRVAPQLVLVPNTRVRVVSDTRWDDDCFHYGGWWWMWHRGWWYRARDWHGPYVVTETRRVPAAIVAVPAKHWKRHPHGGPPGHARAHAAARHEAREHAREHAKERGKGKGKR